jgi:hypothetical protein
LVSSFLSKDLNNESEVELLLGSQGWFIAEVSPKNGEPAVLLLSRLVQGYKTEGVWGGTTVPFMEAPTIREYFRSEAPAAPVSIIRCYKPVTPPFGPGTGSADN